MWAAVIAMAASAAGAATMVVCAPGYPGSTAEAQPAMDGLAAALSDAAGWNEGALGAVYFETEKGGLAALAESGAALAMLTLPMFLEHRQSFDLQPIAFAVPDGRRKLERWVLVAGTGAVTQPADLEGWTVISLAGHSPRFVRGPALGDWGGLPTGAEIRDSGAVLSSLRRAARGEPVAVLLDAEQAAALDRLPFADDLEVVHRSPEMPVSVVCGVGDRLGSAERRKLTAALLSLADRDAAVDALAGVRLDGFVDVEPTALAAAVAAFDEAAE